MSKIIVIKGSPRVEGNSNAMVNAFVKEANKKGFDTEIIDITSAKIGGCKACDCCIKNKGCIYQDDFIEINKKILAAEGLVLASPLYWYAFPSQIKSLIDRWYSVSMAKLDFSGKKVALIGTCEDEDVFAFSGMKLSFEKTMAILKATIVGEVFVSGVNTCGEINNTNGVERAINLVSKF